jgi:hypothetical protein
MEQTEEDSKRREKQEGRRQKKTTKDVRQNYRKTRGIVKQQQKRRKNKNSFCHETTTKVENGPSVLGFRHREEKKYENYTNNNGDKRTICFINE